MASSSSNRSPLRRATDWLRGKAKPNEPYARLEVLLAAMAHPDKAVYDPAFRYLMERFEPMARRVKRNFPTLHPNEALDALGMALASLRVRMERYGQTFETDEHLTNYVRKAVEYSLMSSLKKDRAMPLTFDPTEGFRDSNGTSLPPEVDQVLALQAVQQALTAISQKCQEKLMMVQQGLSYQEIGAALGIVEQSVKTGVMRCRAELKAELLKLGITVDWPRNTSAPDAPLSSP
jgi:RNA polymerase sigma factor (sigma-70 family)